MQLESNYSISDVLTHHRWKQALFTTYALSLTFFESFVMRKLRETGCRDISLIVDVDGYQMSLSERRSSQVGQDYRLIPVALERGVFHAKCMYLSSDEGDILVVGSGNITFGGFGKNIEAFEILDPENNPGVFWEFADFLDLLTIKDDIIAPEMSWAGKFAKLSRRAAEKAGDGPPDQPRLLHSVAEPIVDQLAEILKGLGTVVKINVLSPFYDNDGASIKELTHKLRPDTINIGLPTITKQKINFPFMAANGWKVRVGARLPIIDHKKRTLHAKWFQIESDRGGVLELTGSINATRKALCSTDNIEVGVIRKTTIGSEVLKWEEAKIPSKDTCFSFKNGGIGKKCLIYANIKKDVKLHGVILCKVDLEGIWQGTLENKSGAYYSFEICVNNQGVFEDHLKASEHILFSSGLQISLNKGEVCGRGWVNQEDFLRLSKELRSFSRLISREETIEDEIALMDYLAISAARHQLVFRMPIANHKKKEKGASDPDTDVSVTIDINEIAPNETSDDNGPSSLSELEYRESNILGQIRRVLLGHHRNRDKDEGADVEEDKGDFDDGPKNNKKIKEEAREKRAIEASFEKFRDCMVKLSKESNERRLRKTALVILFEVAMYMYRRKKQKEEALSFLKDWFWRVSQEQFSQEESGALEQHFVTASAIMAAQYKDEEEKEELFTRIHERLESYWQGDVDNDYASQVLIEDVNVGFTDFLLDDLSVDLNIYLESILGSRTIRSLLGEQIERIKDGQHIDGKVFDFLGPVGKEFEIVSQTKRARSSYVIKTVVFEDGVCPNCSMLLVEQQKYYLKHNRLAKCTNCSRYIIDLQP